MIYKKIANVELMEITADDFCMYVCILLEILEKGVTWLAVYQRLCQTKGGSYDIDPKQMHS